MSYIGRNTADRLVPSCLLCSGMPAAVLALRMCAVRSAPESPLTLSGRPQFAVHKAQAKRSSNTLKVGILRGSPTAPLDSSTAAVTALGQTGQAGLLASFLSRALDLYWGTNPTAVRSSQIIQALAPGATELPYDHIAFRSFKVEGLGVDSVAKIFLDHGFTRRDELQFPAKKLRAEWFAPPSGAGLPRIFISELQVEKLSKKVQRIIANYVGDGSGVLTNCAALSTALAALPWAQPSAEDYMALAEESEYAAWTLANGYALNHTTVAVHRLPGFRGGIDAVIEELARHGVHLNDVGSVLKVSPDGGLLQSSTVADTIPYMFSGGEVLDIPASYIEFAERLPLPQYSHLQAHEITEEHRRDGFEVGNADNIFESTRRT